jgi:hypothetical protein
MKTTVLALLALASGAAADGAARTRPSAHGLTSCSRHDDCVAGQYCFFSYDGNSNARGTGYCFADLAPPAEAGVDRAAAGSQPEAAALVETGASLSAAGDGDEILKFNPNGLKVSSLTVQAPEGKSAMVVLGSGPDASYRFGVNPQGLFALSQGDKDVLTVTSDGDIVARTKILAAAQLQADAGFLVNDVAQWAMVAAEDFSQGKDGWATSNAANSGSATTSQCQNGLFMLGGFRGLASHSVSKTFSGLPAHNRLRVRAVYHFIDEWGGETGYMSLSSGNKGAMEYAWTETYDVADFTGLLDVCGAEMGEGRFAVPVDVAIPHDGDSVTVEFGSTLELPAANSSGFYGISSVEIYLRGIEEAVYAK